jgi:hypothetical protein
MRPFDDAVKVITNAERKRYPVRHGPVLHLIEDNLTGATCRKSPIELHDPCPFAVPFVYVRFANLFHGDGAPSFAIGRRSSHNHISVRMQPPDRIVTSTRSASNDRRLVITPRLQTRDKCLSRDRTKTFIPGAGFQSEFDSNALSRGERVRF